MAASKITGKYTGVARDIEMIVVNMSNALGLVTGLQMSDAYLKIRRHIQKYNSRKDCIIQMSIGYPIDSQEIKNLDTKAFFGLFRLKNVIVVASAGNKNPDKVITSVPQRYLHNAGVLRSLSKRFVVVGAYNQEGNGNAIFQTAPFVKVSGPDPSLVASALQAQYGYLGAGDPDPLGLRSGTSFTSPAVTGTMAMWLAAGIFTIDNIVEGMYKLAYNRTEKGPNVLYNGITEDDWARTLNKGP
ncbi:hypothetical protein TWF281_003771 [Arthrobotrys megalospora]